MADQGTQAVGLPGEDGPEIATVNPAPITAGQATPPSAGFGLLQQGLNQFFGQAEQGLDAVSKAVEYDRRREIQTQYYLQRADISQQAKRSQEQAQADAPAGRPMDIELAKNFAYADSYQKVAGQQHGYDLVGQFMRDVYPHLAPGDNAAAAADAFLKREWGPGTGAPAYDAAALSTFKQHLDRAVLAHIENGAKALAATGLQQLDGVVAQRLHANTLSSGDIPGLIKSYQDLDPANPANAPLRLAHVLRATVSGSPEAAQTLLSVLSKPGSGVNGKSYADSFPEGYQEVERTLTENVIQGRSLAGAAAWMDVRNAAANAKTVNDWLDPDNGVLVKANRA